MNPRTDLTGQDGATFRGEVQTRPHSLQTAPRPPIRSISGASFDIDLSFMPPTSPVPTRSGNSSIQENAWYWGQITREEGEKILTDAADGTFLVRDTTIPGDYTLTLRKDGENKHIRIYCRNRKYGFSRPFQFHSVKDLVEYHQTVSLLQYNENLDTCLLYPASRENQFYPTISQSERDRLCLRLQKVHSKVVRDIDDYEKIYHEFDTMEQRIQQHKAAIATCAKTIEIFVNQCSVLELSLNKGGHDEYRLIDNFRRLQCRLQMIVQRREELEKKLLIEVQEKRSQGSKGEALKEEIHDEINQRNEIIRELHAAGMMHYDISNLLHLVKNSEDEEEIYSLVPIDEAEELKHKFPMHCIKENWFFSNYARGDANQLLRHKKTGTFLIRPTAEKSAAYACSLCTDGHVYHCLIYETKNGFGFAEPYNIHQTLEDLVLHYAENSLKPHNSDLDTELVHPARCV